MTGSYGDRRPAVEDVVESPPSLSEAVHERWSRLPRWQRLAVGGPLLGLVVAGLVAYGVSEVRASRAELALDDAVEVSAAMGISATSSSPPGGRVDFYVTLENTGPRPVSITAVDIVVPRLRITDTGIRIRELPPAATMLVPLSVILDCAAQPADLDAQQAVGLALIEAVPHSGRSRTVEVAVSQLAIVTSVADTLCVVQPDLRNLELDGPVLQPAA